MINYYFKLNDESKKYLLKFKNDFMLKGLEDLTLYKDDEVKFYSCTHEYFNSIKFDYKDMTKEEIIDFIKDKATINDNEKIIDIIFQLINMNENTRFKFKKFGIEEDSLMYEVCEICSMIGLKLISKDVEKYGYGIMNEKCEFEKTKEIPASWCSLDDFIEKTR